MIQDVVASFIGSTARGDDEAEARRQHADVAVSEPGQTVLAKDEVCSAFNVGFREELGTGLSEDRVLVAQEFAGVVALVL